MKNFKQRINEKPSIMPQGFAGFIIKNSNAVIDKSFIEKGTSFVNAYENSNVVLKDCGTPTPQEMSSQNINDDNITYVRVSNDKLIKEIESVGLPPWIYYNVEINKDSNSNPKAENGSFLIDNISKADIDNSTFYATISGYHDALETSAKDDNKSTANFSIANQIVNDGKFSTKEVDFTTSGKFIIKNVNSAIKAVWPLNNIFKNKVDVPGLSLRLKGRQMVPIKLGNTLSYIEDTSTYKTDENGDYILDVENQESEIYKPSYKYYVKDSMNEPVVATNNNKVSLSATLEGHKLNLMLDDEGQYFYIMGPYIKETALYDVKYDRHHKAPLNTDKLNFYFKLTDGKTYDLWSLINSNLSSYESVISFGSLSSLSKNMYNDLISNYNIFDHINKEERKVYLDFIKSDDNAPSGFLGLSSITTITNSNELLYGSANGSFLSAELIPDTNTLIQASCKGPFYKDENDDLISNSAIVVSPTDNLQYRELERKYTYNGDIDYNFKIVKSGTITLNNSLDGEYNIKSSDIVKENIRNYGDNKYIIVKDKKYSLYFTFNQNEKAKISANYNTSISELSSSFFAFSVSSSFAFSLYSGNFYLRQYVPAIFCICGPSKLIYQSYLKSDKSTNINTIDDVVYVFHAGSNAESFENYTRKYYCKKADETIIDPNKILKRCFFLNFRYFNNIDYVIDFKIDKIDGLADKLSGEVKFSLKSTKYFKYADENLDYEDENNYINSNGRFGNVSQFSHLISNNLNFLEISKDYTSQKSTKIYEDYSNLTYFYKSKLTLDKLKIFNSYTPTCWDWPTPEIHESVSSDSFQPYRFLRFKADGNLVIGCDDEGNENHVFYIKIDEFYKRKYYLSDDDQLLANDETRTIFIVYYNDTDEDKIKLKRFLKEHYINDLNCYFAIKVFMTEESDNVFYHEDTEPNVYVCFHICNDNGFRMPTLNKKSTMYARSATSGDIKFTGFENVTINSVQCLDVSENTNKIELNSEQIRLNTPQLSDLFTDKYIEELKEDWFNIIQNPKDIFNEEEGTTTDLSSCKINLDSPIVYDTLNDVVEEIKNKITNSFEKISSTMSELDVEIPVTSSECIALYKEKEDEQYYINYDTSNDRYYIQYSLVPIDENVSYTNEQTVSDLEYEINYPNISEKIDYEISGYYNAEDIISASQIGKAWNFVVNDEMYDNEGILYSANNINHTLSCSVVKQFESENEPDRTSDLNAAILGNEANIDFENDVQIWTDGALKNAYVVKNDAGGSVIFKNALMFNESTSEAYLYSDEKKQPIYYNGIILKSSNFNNQVTNSTNLIYVFNNNKDEFTAEYFNAASNITTDIILCYDINCNRQLRCTSNGSYLLSCDLNGNGSSEAFPEYEYKTNFKKYFENFYDWMNVDGRINYNRLNQIIASNKKPVYSYSCTIYNATNDSYTDDYLTVSNSINNTLGRNIYKFKLQLIPNIIR